MAAKDPPPGISHIEQMAAAHHKNRYRGGRPIVPWYDLSVEDRHRLMDAMEASVRCLPDVIVLKAGVATASIDVTPVRDSLLAEHRRAKKSALYGQ